MKKFIAIFFVFSLVGCGSWDKAKKAVGLGESAPQLTAEEQEAQKQEQEAQKKKQEQEEAAERLRQEQEAKRKAEEAKRLSDEEAERQARLAFLKLTTANEAVPTIAQSLQGEELKHDELPLDPWGNLYTVEYSQEWTNRIATVRSNGPDGKKDTADDITAVRKSHYAAGTLAGLGVAGWTAIFWVGCALISTAMLPLCVSYRRAQKKPHKLVNLNWFLLLAAIFGPFMFLWYMISFSEHVYGFDWQFE